MKLYITKAEALEMGFTHEGTLFGIPAWFESERDDAGIAPKFQPFQLWCWFADRCYEAATIFMRADQVLASPIRVTGRIE